MLDIDRGRAEEEGPKVQGDRSDATTDERTNHKLHDGSAVVGDGDVTILAHDEFIESLGPE